MGPDQGEIQKITLDEVIGDVQTLLRKAAHPARKTVRLSPEVAERFRAMEAAVSSQQAEPEQAVTEDSVKPKPPRLETPESVSPPDMDTPIAREKAAALAELAREVSQCTKCDLCKTRTQTVFGSGSPDAGLVFVGEAPGEEEDLQGLPFVGRAGQLLTDIIEKGMQITRAETYICNTVKCRPPGNRDPLPEEKAACEPYLKLQLKILQPRVICALGTHAAQTLLRTETTIGKLRLGWHEYEGIPLKPTYHPAYLLRSPGEKRKTWEDVLEVLRVYRGGNPDDPKA